MILDSSQATYLSADGSQATFELTGGDIELLHAEAHTASVALTEFHAANTIYNIDNTCNTLETLVQYMDASGNFTYTNTVLVIVPNGSYNIITLVAMINEQVHMNLWKVGAATYTPPASSPYFANFQGANQVCNFFPSFGNFQYSVTSGDGSFNFVPFISIDFFSTKATSTMAWQPPGSVTSSYPYGNGITNLQANFNKTFKVRLNSPTVACLGYQQPTYYSMTYGNAGGLNAGFKYFVNSIYLVTNNYPGLATKLGFPNNLASPINSLSTTATKGYGMSFSRVDKTTSTSTFSVNPGPNVDICSYFYATNTDSVQALLPQYGGTTGYHGFILAPRCPSLDSPRNIYVCVDSITSRNRCSNPLFPFGSVLQKIPTGSPDFGQIIYYASYTDRNEVLVPGLSLDTITVRLYGDDGLPILWNGGHWTIILSVKYAVDVGSAGLEDATLGRTHRPFLHQTGHDPLTTRAEYLNKRGRHN